MRLLLLDTHAFLWVVLDDPRLGATARALIVDPDNDIAASPAMCSVAQALVEEIPLKKFRY